MKRFGQMSVLLLAGLLLVGCGGDSHDKVSNDMVTAMEQLVKTLETVKDEKSAKAAAPKVEAFTKKMASIETRMKEVGDPSAEVEEQLKAKYEQRMTEASQKLMGEMMRIGMNPTLSGPLDDAMSKISN